jgi:DNA-binding Xre family transcriptional regulator
MGIRVKEAYISQVKRSLPQHGYWNQKLLAENAGLAQSTVARFVNGQPIHISNFFELCHLLDLDANEIGEQPSGRIDESPEPLEGPQPPETLPSSTSFAFPAGLVSLRSPFYVARSPQEEQCYRAITEVGALIRIKAPRQFGKTSLLVRVLNCAEQHGHHIIYISLQEVESEFLTSSRTFLAWFYRVVAAELELFEHIEHYEKLAATVGGVSACVRCFKDYLLPNLSKPLTLGLDELDRILDVPSVSKDFFALLRVMNENSKLDRIWQNFRLVLVHAIHSIEVFVQLDINQSPFNVGLPIELTEFTPEQIHDLSQRCSLNWQETDIQQLMELVGGMPFLVRLMMYHVVSHNISLGQVLQNESAVLELYREHLERLEQIISNKPDLTQAMRAISEQDGDIGTSLSQIPLTAKYQLHSLGLLKSVNDIHLRCELYRRYFCR